MERLNNIRRLLGALLVVIWIMKSVSHGLELEHCASALGMESGEIPNEALSASSQKSEDVGPFSSRVRTEILGGAWCPARDIERGVYEYLQIDLGELKVITLVETQGRFGSGQGQHYAERYGLDYQREDGGPWFHYRDRRQQEHFPGNSNTYSPEMRQVDPPIIARRIRFVPFSTDPKPVCMRVELFGCTSKDHVVSYDMPQGHTRGELELFDFTYDGSLENGYLTGGIGQLFDGEHGGDYFRLDPKNSGIKGYDWIGWRNETQEENKPVEIVFKFDSMRNFTSFKIKTNNQYKRDVSVFRMALIQFSNGGKFYQTDPIMYKYTSDPVIETARAPVIDLYNKIGRYVKVALFFDLKWIMISEVEFQSEKAIGNFPDEVALIRPPGIVTPSNKSPKEEADPSPAYNVPTRPGGLDVGQIKSKITKLDGRTTVPHQPGEISVLQNSNGNIQDVYPDKKMNDGVIGIIIGTLAVLIVLFVVIFVLFCVRRRKKYRKGNQVVKLGHELPYHYNEDEIISSDNKKNTMHIYNFENANEFDWDKDVASGTSNGHGLAHVIHRQLPDVPLKTPLLSGRNTPHPYAMSTLPAIHAMNGTNIYAAPFSMSLPWRNQYPVMEFPREHLRFIEKLGEGQFGEVQLCEVLEVAGLLGDNFLLNRTGSTSVLVAVKTLRPDASEAARQDFHKEVQLMCQLRDANIVQVLGVCTKDEPLSVIVEYMRFGDLHQFLCAHEPEGFATLRRKAQTLTSGCLVYMATQIASGMSYLECRNMIHRDLAARNCLVGNQYTIKISDFGMSRSLYSCDYYKIEGKAVLPIRWMACESVILGKFSTKSDVWSFGVTLWEILNFARSQPYENLSDEQVIENCEHFHRNDALGTLLPAPPTSYKELYDLMLECWNVEDTFRPSFREIHMFLQRKNIGYDPREG